MAWNGGKTAREWGETASNGGKTAKMLGICKIMLVSMLFSSIPTIYASILVIFPPLSPTIRMVGLRQMGGIFPPFVYFPPHFEMVDGGKIMSPSTSIMGGKYRFPLQALFKWEENSPPIVLFSPHLKFHFPPIMGGKNNLCPARREIRVKGSHLVTIKYVKVGWAES